MHLIQQEGHTATDRQQRARGGEGEGGEGERGRGREGERGSGRVGERGREREGEREGGRERSGKAHASALESHSDRVRRFALEKKKT